MAQSDKIQIGVTKENNAVLERIEEMGLFAKQHDIASFAMAYAIREGVMPGVVSNSDTKWHTKGLDPNGEMAAAVVALFPGVDAPYRAIESLINSGLQKLEREIDRQGTLDLSKYLPPQ